MRKRVGILGFGRSAIHVANKFLKHGYEVMMGTNQKELFAEWFNQSEGRGWVGNYEEAACFGDFVVLAASENLSEFLLDMAGGANLHEKTVIDICEPTTEEKSVEVSLNEKVFKSLSITGKLQSKYSRVNFVKAFSGNGSLLEAGLEVSKKGFDLFIYGNIEKAKENATIAFASLGWNCSDEGTLLDVPIIKNVQI